MGSVNNDESNDRSGSRFNQDIYSKVIRAGKRTYFFDVKSTRQNEFYLTITESKRRFEDDGHPVFEKHKIFLYREDFNKFMDSLKEIYDFIDQKQPLPEETIEETEVTRNEPDTGLLNVEFDDLTN
jgi:hypothetical protein